MLIKKRAAPLMFHFLTCGNSVKSCGNDKLFAARFERISSVIMFRDNLRTLCEFLLCMKLTSN